MHFNRQEVGSGLHMLGDLKRKKLVQCTGPSCQRFRGNGAFRHVSPDDFLAVEVNDEPAIAFQVEGYNRTEPIGRRRKRMPEISGDMLVGWIRAERDRGGNRHGVRLAITQDPRPFRPCGIVIGQGAPLGSQVLPLVVIFPDRPLGHQGGRRG